MKSSIKWIEGRVNEMDKDVLAIMTKQLAIQEALNPQAFLNKIDFDDDNRPFTATELQMRNVVMADIMHINSEIERIKNMLVAADIRDLGLSAIRRENSIPRPPEDIPDLEDLPPQDVDAAPAIVRPGCSFIEVLQAPAVRDLLPPKKRPQKSAVVLTPKNTIKKGKAK